MLDRHDQPMSRTGFSPVPNNIEVFILISRVLSDTTSKGGRWLDEPYLIRDIFQLVLGAEETHVLLFLRPLQISQIMPHSAYYSQQALNHCS